MKLIASGKNGYLNADYIIAVTVVEQGNKFVVKVDFRGGANAIIGSYDMQDEAIKHMHTFAAQLNEEN